jgi:hypothetical protein
MMGQQAWEWAVGEWEEGERVRDDGSASMGMACGHVGRSGGMWGRGMGGGWRVVGGGWRVVGGGWRVVVVVGSRRRGGGTRFGMEVAGARRHITLHTKSVI